jgi:hypothetical protein
MIEIKVRRKTLKSEKDKRWWNEGQGRWIQKVEQTK